MLQFLLTLADDSNHGKIEHIYNMYHDYMMKCAVAKLKSCGRSNYVFDAEDAVQSTFMNITMYIDKIDFSRGENDVKNYCLAILNNEICNIIGDNQEKIELDEEFFPGGEYRFIDTLEIQEKYDRVVAAIEELDPKYSTTMQLFFSKGMTANEIAELMVISPKTVYTRLSRGKNLLLQSLKGTKLNG